jgi:hypothetical protein
MVLALPLLWGAAAIAQEFRSPADVVPDSTMAYVELREPGKIAGEIAGLLKGSALGNVPDSMAKLREKYASARPGAGGEEVAAVGAILSPELISELSRIRGAAAAVTGVDPEDKNLPEFVAFLMPGESNFPGLIFRAFLASFNSDYSSFEGKVQSFGRTRMEPIGECEGVQVYRAVTRRSTTTAGRNGQPATTTTDPAAWQSGPALARLPSGVILVGTAERVKDVIRRAKGDADRRQAPLSSHKTYREAVKQLGDRPGLYWYGNPSALLTVFDQAVPPREKDMYFAFKDLLNPAAVAGVAASLTIDSGTLNLRSLARLDPAEKSPVREILPSKPLNLDVLHFAPRDAVFVAALSNADGEARWERLVQLADQVAKIVGMPNMPPPSRMIAGGEGMLGLKIGKDLLGKIDTIAVAVPDAQRLQSMLNDPVPPAVVIIRATAEDAAVTLVKEAIPRIVGTVRFQEGARPSEKEVAGQTIYEFDFGPNARLCYGRSGATLVLGMNPSTVADSLASGGTKRGVPTGDRAAATLQRAGEPVVLLIAKPLSIAGLVMSARFGAAHEVRRFDGPGPAADPVVTGVMRLAKAEEPLVLTVSRRPDAVIKELSYPGLNQLMPRAVDFFLEAAFHAEACQRTISRSVPAGGIVPQPTPRRP